MTEISIIIPTYNSSKDLRRCLKSVIEQSFKDIEIICINDGSTDNTEDILKEYAKKDQRIIIINQINKKQGSARNAGLKIAKGKYIGFIDSDDWIDNNYYEELYKTITKYNADIAVTNILKHKKRYNKYLIKYKKNILKKEIQSKIKLCQDKKQNFFSCWNKLYKREILSKNNIIFSENRIYEDVIFSIKALYYSKELITVPNTTYHYIEQKNSTINSKSNIKQKRIDLKLAGEELIEFAYKNKIKLPERANYYKTFWITPFIKIYKGIYKTKITLLGLIPIFISTKSN